MHRAMLSAVAIGIVLVPGSAWAVDAPSRVEHSKSEPPPGNSLGTKHYEATDAEKAATKDWKEDELSSGSPDIESLKGDKGRRIAWFGIIREITEDKGKDETRLLVEMRYFDGLTDLHQQIVSQYGAGDFRASIPGVGYKLKLLSLVRLYGTVTGDIDELPLIAAQYVRSWDWGQFAFMGYGDDHGNPEWRKLRNTTDDDDYSADPDDAYYQQRLGKR